jgi:hypothetical protein
MDGTEQNTEGRNRDPELQPEVQKWLARMYDRSNATVAQDTMTS